MVGMTLRGQFTLANYRTEVQTIIERLHPTVQGMLCVFVVSLDLTFVLYALVNPGTNTNEVFDVLTKQMGEEATYASVFDMHLPDRNVVIKGLVYV